jgi:hypothetical protein
MTRLTSAGFENKSILVLEVTKHQDLTISDDAFYHLESLQQLFIHQNSLIMPNVNFFNRFLHLRSLTVLDLDYNGLNLTGVDNG